jgi:hypothetical protein
MNGSGCCCSKWHRLGCVSPAARAAASARNSLPPGRSSQGGSPGDRAVRAAPLSIGDWQKRRAGCLIVDAMVAYAAGRTNKGPQRCKCRLVRYLSEQWARSGLWGSSTY